MRNQTPENLATHELLEMGDRPRQGTTAYTVEGLGGYSLIGLMGGVNGVLRKGA